MVCVSGPVIIHNALRTGRWELHAEGGKARSCMHVKHMLSRSICPAWPQMVQLGIELLLMRRLVAVDQHTGPVYLLALHKAGCLQCAQLADAWLQDTASAVQALKPEGRSSLAAAHSNGSHAACEGGQAGGSPHNGPMPGQSDPMQPSCEACRGYEAPAPGSKPAKAKQHDAAANGSRMDSSQQVQFSSTVTVLAS